MKNKIALIIGISGQDGAFLAKHLINNGYMVFGTSRDVEMNSFYSLYKLVIKEQVKLISMSLVDFRRANQTFFDVKPDEVYNLAGQTSVDLSFKHPV